MEQLEKDTIAKKKSLRNNETKLEAVKWNSLKLSVKLKLDILSTMTYVEIKHPFQNSQARSITSKLSSTIIKKTLWFKQLIWTRVIEKGT